jgi:hypothetical protein
MGDFLKIFGNCRRFFGVRCQKINATALKNSLGPMFFEFLTWRPGEIFAQNARRFFSGHPVDCMFLCAFIQQIFGIY